MTKRNTIKRETQTIWFKRIEDWRKSGLSQADYCRRHQLKPGNFYNWSGKYRQELGDTNSPPDWGDLRPEFIPVTVSTAPSELTLTCGDVSLTFSSPVTPDTLVPWIKAMRAGAC